MLGLQLAQNYFEEHRDTLRSHIEGFDQHFAVALLGQGSECLGLDDEHSQDHDFGPRFLIIAEKKFAQSHPQIIAQVEQVYASLPDTYRHEGKEYQRPDFASYSFRSGFCSLEDLCLYYLGQTKLPQCSREWLALSEYGALCLCNGKVFMDGPGKLSEIRKTLAAYFPQEVQKKKLAAYLAELAQSGQYNYPRSLKRGDLIAAQFSLTEFIQAVYAALYLFAGEYRPFYKWQHAYVSSQQIYSPHLFEDIETLARRGLDLHYLNENLALVEEISAYLALCARNRFDLQTQDNFLQVLAEELSATIHDPYLKSLHLLRGGISRAS